MIHRAVHAAHCGCFVLGFPWDVPWIYYSDLTSDFGLNFAFDLAEIVIYGKDKILDVALEKQYLEIFIICTTHWKWRIVAS